MPNVNIPKTVHEALNRGYRKLTDTEKQALPKAQKMALADCSQGNPGQICAYGPCQGGQRTIYVCDHSGSCDDSYQGPC
jgi:hypothetical protein